MLTRKYYREFAESIRQQVDWLPKEQAKGAATVARALAADLKKDNPRFDWAKFFSACGLNDLGRVT